jgi:Rrf2 family protein
MISKTEEYALRAAIHLARLHANGPVRSSTLARVTGIPANYLSKVLHQLGRHGVVVSERGRNGGFRLARDPAEVTLAELLFPFAPQAGRARCLLGQEECSDDDPCPAHKHWKGAKAMIGDFFSQTTLGDVIADGGE